MTVRKTRRTIEYLVLWQSISVFAPISDMISEIRKKSEMHIVEHSYG